MLRVIFDSNIYGLLARGNNINIITEKIIKDREFIVYGYQLIRKELRSTPKYLKLGKFSQRNTLLGLYDKITNNWGM